MYTLYLGNNRQPINLESFTKKRVGVRRYVMPEKVGSIYTPAADNKTLGYSEDTTQTLWEVVVPNNKADEEVGMSMDVDDIIVTTRRWPTPTGLTDEEGRAIFVLDPDHHNFMRVIKYG